MPTKDFLTSSRRLAQGGIFLALGLLLLLVARMSPLADLYIYALICVLLCEECRFFGMRTALFWAVALGILSFWVSPPPSNLALLVVFLPYALFREGMQKLLGQRPRLIWGLKWLFAMFLLLISFFFARLVLGDLVYQAILQRYEMWCSRFGSALTLLLGVLGFSVLFFLFDRLLTQFLSWSGRILERRRP